MKTKLELKSKYAGYAGFTLIELLIVIMILGILVTATLTVINPSRQRLRAQDAILQGTVSKIGAAVDAFYSVKIRPPNAGSEFLGEVQNATQYSGNTANHWYFTEQGINTGAPSAANWFYYAGTSYTYYPGCVAAPANQEGYGTYYVKQARGRIRKCIATNSNFQHPYYSCGFYLGWWSSYGYCTDELN